MFKKRHELKNNPLDYLNWPAINSRWFVTILTVLMICGSISSCGKGREPGSGPVKNPGFVLHSASVSEGQSGSVSLQFEVTLKSSQNTETSVDYNIILPTAEAIAAGQDIARVAGLNRGDEAIQADALLCPESTSKLACQADIPAGAVTGTVTFASGETRQFISIPVTSDTLYEKDEVIVVELINPVGAEISDDADAGRQLGIIKNDDDPPEVSIEVLGNEGLTLDENTSATRQLKLSLSAESGVDAIVSLRMRAASENSDPPRASYKGDFIVYQTAYGEQDLQTGKQDCDPRAASTDPQQNPRDICDSSIRVDAPGNKFLLYHRNTLLTLPAGSTEKQLTLRVIDDGFAEVDEKIYFTVDELESPHVKSRPGVRSVDLMIAKNDQRDVLRRKLLNDTGVTQRISSESLNLNILQQDAAQGRDAADPEVLNKKGAGRKGFDFTRLNQQGDVVEEQADARCIHDNHTGLVWEVKIVGNAGLQAAGKYFSWYNPDFNVNGGDAGKLHKEDCEQQGCNTMYYEMELNLMALCGLTGWRLPDVGELRGIADYGVRKNASGLDKMAYDIDYFPNQTSPSDYYWSVTSAPGDTSTAYVVSYSGALSISARSKASQRSLIRLVNDSLQQSID